MTTNKPAASSPSSLGSPPAERTDTERLDYIEAVSEEDVFRWPTEYLDEEITLRQAIDRRMDEEGRYERSHQEYLARQKESPDA